MTRGKGQLICTPGLAPCDDLNCGTCMPRRQFDRLQAGLMGAPLTADSSGQQESMPKVAGGSSTSESATKLIPIPSSNLQASSSPSKSCEEISIKLYTRIALTLARTEEPNPCITPQKRVILHGALEHIYALRDRLHGMSGPTPRAEMSTPLQVKAALQDIIPERLLKKGKAIAIGKGKKKWRIKLMFAVDLYLDELESEVTELGQNAWRSQEADEEEWNGFSDTDVSQDQQQHANVERCPVNLEQAMEEQGSSLDAFEGVLDVYRNTIEDCRLRIGNLAATITEAELGGFLSGYKVKTISIMSGKKRDGLASALLSFWSAVETKEARSELSGKELLGRKVSVRRARGTEYIPTARVARKRRESLLRMRREWGHEVETIETRADAEAHTTSEAQVEKALSKIEQWCDLWLSRNILEDRWHTFDDCLDLE